MSGALSHLPSEIIGQLLIDLGLGSLVSARIANPVYIENTPESPDNLIVVNTTTSVLQGRDQTNGEMQEKFGIQIVIRNQTPTDGWLKAKEIQNALDLTIENNTVSILDTTGTASSSYLVAAITRTSGILSLGKETEGGMKTDRNLFTINAIASIRETI